MKRGIKTYLVKIKTHLVKIKTCIPGQNERSSSTPALKIVALVSTPGYLQCKKIN